MLITDRFVFIHVPKTGGDFIRRICLRHLPAESIVAHQIAKHGPDTEIPAAYAALPRFALVRNPWDWHVSWYHYLMGAGRPDEHRDRVRVMNPWFVELSDGFTADFATTMRRLYDPQVARTFPAGSVVRTADRAGGGPAHPPPAPPNGGRRGRRAPHHGALREPARATSTTSSPATGYRSARGSAGTSSSGPR